MSSSDEQIGASIDRITTHLLEQLQNSSPSRGPRLQRRYIDRGRADAEQCLFRDYFAENPTYPEYKFRRRFRMRKSLFLKIVGDMEASHDYFKQRRSASGMLGFHPIQRCTAVLRMLAYGTHPDALDESIRMSARVAKYLQRVQIVRSREIHGDLRRHLVDHLWTVDHLDLNMDPVDEYEDWARRNGNSSSNTLSFYRVTPSITFNLIWILCINLSAKLKKKMRARTERDEVSKDLSVWLTKPLCFLIVFVIGIVIGLVSSAHVDRYFTSQPYNLNRDRESIPPNSPSATTPDDQDCTATSLVIKCVAEDCLSIKNFISQKNLSHSMTDEELFWRASLVPENAHYPFDRMPKIAFMFFKGQDPKKYSIYVHTNPDFELGVSNSSVFYNRQIPSQVVEWGTVSLVDAERRLLSNALLDFSNERFVLLSESCIPIYNFRTIYKYLTKSTLSYLDSYDDPSKYGRGRYSRQMKPEIRIRDWRKGSQWFEMNRALAIKIIADLKYYDLFKKYCTEDCYPDEHYMPTFVHMFYGELNAERTVTFVDWSIGGPHPASFEGGDVSKGFLESLRKNGSSCLYNEGTTDVCYLFARKFGVSALEPLLEISSEVFEY
ncbi:hypothetical protein LXL04_038834 [Taraxacum kok-saghyz]